MNIPPISYPLCAPTPLSYKDDFPLNAIDKKMLTVISNEKYYRKQI